jgi:ferrous iron transport protein B
VIDKNDFQLSLSDKVDALLTNRWLGIPFFALIMWLVYFVSVQILGAIASDWLNDVLFGKILPHLVTQILLTWQVADFMQSLIVDGILAGVGSVLGFVSQIALLFCV